MEVWRLLDVDCSMIPYPKLAQRVVSIPTGPKTLARALGIGDGQSQRCKMPLAIIIDDRKDVSPSPISQCTVDKVPRLEFE